MNHAANWNARFVLALVAASLLSGCAGTPPVQTKIVEVDKPVAVQPIKPADVPAAPPPLGPRPPTLPQAADELLAQVCRFVEFTDRAMPLLTVSAGLPPAQAPFYSECAKK